MTISEKYDQLRPQISDGDLIVVRGTGVIAKIIQWADNSWASHILVVVEKHGALYCVDANANGVQADRLSYRIGSYKSNADFVILKPLSNRYDIDREMRILLAKSDKNTIKYDFKNGIKEGVNRKFRTKLAIRPTDKEDICSDFVRNYYVGLSMCVSDFTRLAEVFPQDYLDYTNPSNCKIITL